jgi:uncharacterized membrane protein YhhN
MRDTPIILTLLAIVLGVCESIAIYKKWRVVEYFAKPGLMVCLSVALVLGTGLRGAAFWFGLGGFFSLAGDVFMLWRERMFLFGLAIFLLAQIGYLIGFNSPPPPLSMWGMLMAVVIGIGSARVLRRLLAGVHASDQSPLALPVLAYGTVMTLMVLSALLNLYNTGWEALAALCAATGAFLIYLSDIILAWDKFVKPVRNGRLTNVSMYQAGQVLLIAGVMMQFSPA